MMATLISTLDQLIRVTDDPKEFITPSNESLCDRKSVNQSIGGLVQGVSTHKRYPRR